MYGLPRYVPVRLASDAERELGEYDLDGAVDVDVVLGNIPHRHRAARVVVGTKLGEYVNAGGNVSNDVVGNSEGWSKVARVVGGATAGGGESAFAVAVAAGDVYGRIGGHAGTRIAGGAAGGGNRAQLVDCSLGHSCDRDYRGCYVNSKIESGESADVAGIVESAQAHGVGSFSSDIRGSRIAGDGGDLSVVDPVAKLLHAAAGIGRA
jgi:hypothetical protein